MVLLGTRVAVRLLCCSSIGVSKAFTLRGWVPFATAPPLPAAACVQVRYQTDDIYTYTGSILIAVNPFAAMPHIYGLHMMEQYRGLGLGELSPHVYAIADESYRQMRKEKRSQSILVGGGRLGGQNSGAGWAGS